MSDRGHIDNILCEAASYESNAAYAKQEAALEMKRPFMLLRPRIFQDGNQWCALYGENLHEGVCGFGETPEKASIDFDINWLNAKAKSTSSSKSKIVIGQCESDNTAQRTVDEIRKLKVD